MTKKVKNKIITTFVFYGLTFGCASANVIEFKGGEVISHIAADYRALAKAENSVLQVQTLTIVETIDAPERLLSLILAASEQHEIDPTLINAIIAQESNYSDSVVSPKGAQGLMQLMPATAERYGVKDAFDASQNIDGGILYFKDLLARYNGNIDFALAAYNAGEGAVDKYGGIPPYKETLDYVNRINKKLKRGAYAPHEEIEDADSDIQNEKLPAIIVKKTPSPLLVFGEGERIADD